MQFWKQTCWVRGNFNHEESPDVPLWHLIEWEWWVGQILYLRFGQSGTIYLLSHDRYCWLLSENDLVPITNSLSILLVLFFKKSITHLHFNNIVRRILLYSLFQNTPNSWSLNTELNSLSIMNNSVEPWTLLSRCHRKVKLTWYFYFIKCRWPTVHSVPIFLSRPIVPIFLLGYFWIHQSNNIIVWSIFFPF